MHALSDTEPLAPAPSKRWLLVTLGAVFILSFPSLRYPLGRDQATQCVMASGLLHGRQLYRDLWDNRPPGIFYLYTVFVLLFGRVMWLAGVVDLLWLVAIDYFIFRFGKRYLGAPAGMLAAVLYTLLHERAGFESAAQPECFIVLFVFLADSLLMARQRRWPEARSFVAGILFGAAFWMKYNAGLFILLGMVLPFWDASGLDERPGRWRLNVPWKKWFERTAFLALGFGAAVVIPIAYFVHVGAWPALVQAQFEVLPRYGLMVLSRQQDYFVWMLTAIHWNLRGWVEASVAIALALAWRRRELSRLAPVLFAAFIGFMVTVSQLNFHSYYFETCLPFLAMIVAYAGVALFKEFQTLAGKLRERKMGLAQVLVWLVFANIIYFPLPGLAMILRRETKGLVAWVRDPKASYRHYAWPDPNEHLRGQLQVIRYLKANAGAGDQVFVWGTAPLIYFMTGKQPPNRFVSNLGLMAAWGPAAWRRELVRDLRQSLPRFIVVARHDAVYGITYTHLDSAQYLARYPGLARILRRHYREVVPGRNFIIYRRRSSRATAQAFLRGWGSLKRLEGRI